MDSSLPCKDGLWGMYEILQRPSNYRLKKTPDTKLSVRVQSSIWIESSTFFPTGIRTKEELRDCRSKTLTPQPRRHVLEIFGIIIRLDVWYRSVLPTLIVLLDQECSDLLLMPIQTFKTLVVFSQQNCTAFSNHQVSFHHLESAVLYHTNIHMQPFNLIVSP